MSFLDMMEAKLPPGFRFHPRDEELVSDYLAKKVSGDGGGFLAMLIDVDLNKWEPWDLPEMACVGGKEWYFYCLRDRKYASGQRMNRAAVSGYWKATGKDRPVIDPRRGEQVGMRKTLVFYHGKAPKGRKTEWAMHEFRLGDLPRASTTSLSVKEDWVLCRVFQRRSGFPSEPSAENPHEVAGHSSFPAQLSLEGYQWMSCSSSHLPGQQPQWRATSHVSPVKESMPEMEKDFDHLGVMPNHEKARDGKGLPELVGNPRIEWSSSSYLSEPYAPHMGNQSF